MNREKAHHRSLSRIAAALAGGRRPAIGMGATKGSACTAHPQHELPESKGGRDVRS